eukprot:3159089-Prymnesium_polylepis.2
MSGRKVVGCRLARGRGIGGCLFGHGRHRDTPGEHPGHKGRRLSSWCATGTCGCGRVAHVDQEQDPTRMLERALNGA